MTSVVVQDELAAGRLATAPFQLDIVESFYAITIRRSFPHPLLENLVSVNLAPTAGTRD